MPRAGFTLIELLAVITLIAMLMAMMFGAAQYVIKLANKNRGAATAKALESAIATYRRAYNQWPVDPSLVGSITNGTLTIPGTNNYLLFDMLRAVTNNLPPFNPSNTNNIHFIDDSTVLAENPIGSGQCIPRHRLPGSGGMIVSGHPIVYQGTDGANRYYSITIEFETDKVTVSQ